MAIKVYKQLNRSDRTFENADILQVEPDNISVNVSSYSDPNYLSLSNRGYYGSGSIPGNYVFYAWTYTVNEKEAAPPDIITNTNVTNVTVQTATQANPEILIGSSKNDDLSALQELLSEQQNQFSQLLSALTGTSPVFSASESSPVSQVETAVKSAASNPIVWLALGGMAVYFFAKRKKRS